MSDSGIERTVTLPELPKLSGLDREDILDIQDYLKRLSESIAAFHDQLAGRINEFLTFQEWQEITPAQITADQSNYALDDFGIVHRLSADAPWTIHGIVAPQVARFVILLNAGAQTLSIPHQSVSSMAENRVITATGATLTLSGNQSAALWYDIDPGTLRWRQLML